MNYFEILKADLKEKVKKHNLYDKNIRIKAKVLSAEEAIGNPEKKDFPIIKGKEKMIEAEFEEKKGQAFTDEFAQIELKINQLLNLDLDSNKNRAFFIASLNAIYNYLGELKHVIHCKNQEPADCAQKLDSIVRPNQKVLLVGFQPRFMEFLANFCELYVVDMDEDNINQIKFGVKINSPERTDEFIKKSDLILVTGTTAVNGTLSKFLNLKKQTYFYGTTIAATAKILKLNRFCNS